MLQAPVAAHKSTGGPGGEQAPGTAPLLFTTTSNGIEKIQEDNRVNFILVILKLELQRKYIHLGKLNRS